MMLSFHEEEEGLPDSFLSNFPSLIKVDIHAKVTDPSVAKSMMGCLLSSLKANGRWRSLLLRVLTPDHIHCQKDHFYDLRSVLVWTSLPSFFVSHPQGLLVRSVKFVRLIRE